MRDRMGHDDRPAKKLNCLSFFFGAISAIADDGMADGGKLGADLMVAACGQLDPDPGRGRSLFFDLVCQTGALGLFSRCNDGAMIAMDQIVPQSPCPGR
jgi:hypothetical protein